MKTNVKRAVPKIYTHEGAVAVYIDSTLQLRRSVMANMLWEDSFYESGQSIADRIGSEVAELLKEEDGARSVANIAVEARSQFKLRHVPLLLLAHLIHAQTDKTRAVVADAIMATVQRPDELGELVSIYWKVNGGKKMVPNQMKKGLAGALAKFEEYSLAKYDSDSDGVKLRDVLFLSHAKPVGEEQTALYKKIAERGLKTPDTWEVALSGGADKKETFTRLIAEKKLGALALLRNLRNMEQAGVEMSVIREALTGMKTERVLPFRFITAARYAPKLEPELEQAMFKCLVDHEKLTGKTVLVVDHSGSMDSEISGKSELKRIDAACALAMLLREVCDEVQVVVFGSTAGLVRPRRGFALRDEIVRSEHGCGTNTGLALQIAEREGYDRCIVITDEQSHTSISAPPKEAKGYFVNVAAYKNGIGYGRWNHIDGWSEAIIDWIMQFEKFESQADAE